MNLKSKVPLLVVAAIIVAAAATGGFVAVELHSVRASQFEDTALSAAAMVQESLRRHMLDGRPTSVQYVTRARTASSVDRISLVSADGLIVASTEGALMGTVTNDALVWQALRTGEVATRSGTQARPSAYDLVSPIAYTGECSSCHDPTRPVLGAVHIGLNTTADDSDWTRWLLSRAEQTAVMMAVIGAILAVGLKLMILDPLVALERTARLISQGDYSARADASRRDEIGTLARTINDSARRIATHTSELTKRNTELELDTQQRTGELQALNAVVTAASESHDLREILETALAQTLAASGFDDCVVIISTEPGLLVQTGVPAALLDRIRQNESVGNTACPAIADRTANAVTSDARGLLPSGEVGAAGVDSGYVTTIRIPIASKDEHLGAIWLFGQDPRTLEPQQARWLAAIADAVAVAAKRTRFSERLRSANDRLTALLERAVQGGFDVTYENPHLVRCWIDKRCDNTECPARESENLRCWQIAGSYSPNGMPGPNGDRLADCKDCQVFRKSCGRDEITSIGESFNNMMMLLDIEARKRSELRRQLIERLMSAQEDERKRVARELHDQTGQSLTMLLVGLKHLEKAANLEQVRTQVVSLEGQTIQALDEVHHLALELRPSVLDELGLLSALRAHLRLTSARCNVRTDIKVTGPETRLLPAVETALYRIVQESVTNAVKHAEARSIVVSLDRKPLSVAMKVQDDGRGFDVASLGKKRPTQSSGLGLAGIKERAVLLGGTFVVTSQPGAGTAISVEIPLSAATNLPEPPAWHLWDGARVEADVAAAEPRQVSTTAWIASVSGGRSVDGQVG